MTIEQAMARVEKEQKMVSQIGERHAEAMARIKAAKANKVSALGELI
jgi:hypothetical protein